ncbi:MAG: putative sugar nucleotidyl transferase [Aigarchaeota archaeon]|nr:putative sugar nucleotidyl transferase [Aigarchaeota archaeon]MDW8092999.1 putative sugar nucleotidyl transferase [Nitrososphaerota archaeon]
MDLVIFEDSSNLNFAPLTLTRPVYELRVGTSTIREKLLEAFRPDGRVVTFCRDHLREIALMTEASTHVNDADVIGDEVLLINGSLIPRGELTDVIKSLRRGSCITSRGRVVAARLGRAPLDDPHLSSSLMGGDVLRAIAPHVSELSQRDDAMLLNYPWELIYASTELLQEETRSSVGLESSGEVHDSVIILGDRRRLYVGEAAVVEAFSVIDVRRGPVYVGERAHVQSHSRIEGPAYLGRDCIVFGAQIRGGCSVGDNCRIGGEVEATVFHPHSNKRHYGYIGHSYIGEWVNIGAGTTISNMKNTYGTVRVTLNGQRIDSGKTFLGAFVADHVKTAIGTYIFSGKRIGVASHLYGLVTEDVPSFTSYQRNLNGKLVEIAIDSVVISARRMMKRRNLDISAAHEKLLREVFELTKAERAIAKVMRDRLSI